MTMNISEEIFKPVTMITMPVVTMIKMLFWGEELSIGHNRLLLLLVPLGSKHHTEKVNPKQNQSP
jgi:hypothetical protein